MPRRLLEIKFLNKKRKALRELVAQKPWWCYLPFEHTALFILLLFNTLMVLPLFKLKNSPNIFSAPVLPLICQGIARIAGVDFSQVVVWVILFLGSLGFFSLYFFVRELTGRRLPGLLAAAFYSLPVAGSFPLWTRHALELGDGSHIAALAFTPTVSYFTLRFLKSGRFNLALFGGIGNALVALTSPFGFFVLLVFLAICTFSETLLGRARIKFLRLIVCLGLAAGFSAFWYNPLFVKKVALESWQGQSLISTFWQLLPLSFFTLPVLGTFGLLIFERKPGLQPLFLSLGLFFAFFFLNLGGRVVQRDTKMPSRFMPEFLLSCSFVGGVVVTHVFDLLRGARQLSRFSLNEKMAERLGLAFVTVILAVCVFWIVRAVSYPVEVDAYGRVLGASEGEVSGIWEIKQETGETFFIWIGRAITLTTGVFVVYLRRRLSA